MITKTVEIKLSGKDLADELWELDCQEQADFFNKNGFVSLQKKKKETIVRIQSAEKRYRK